MKIEIKSRFNGSALFAHYKEENSIKITLEAAVMAGADLAGANLAGADLAGAYLAGANLAGADLARADLAGAYLAGANLARANLARANLAGANLDGANLDGANLAGIKVNWTSHDLIAEILRRWAKDSIPRRMLVGLIVLSRDWCWPQFLRIKHPEKKAVLAELSRWLQKDEKAPWLPQKK